MKFLLPLIAIACLSGCFSSGNTDSNAGDASVEIDALINAVCVRNVACGQGGSVSACVVSTELNLVGDPFICDVSQEEMCLKEAASLPCADAGGGDDGTAISACGPCQPPPIDLPDASPSHPVDACSLFDCNDN